LDRDRRLVPPLQLLSNSVPAECSLNNHGATHCSVITRRVRLLRLRLRLLLLLLVMWLLLRLWLWRHMPAAVEVSRGARDHTVAGADDGGVMASTIAIVQNATTATRAKACGL
jgi:hypothetical protein